jgi:MraZ protein
VDIRDDLKPAQPEEQVSAALDSANPSIADAMKDWQLNGAFWHSIDPKGRVIIPQFFREQLGEGIVVSVNTAQDSIAVYPLDVWHERVKMLNQLVRKKRALEPILSRFSMLSYQNCNFDQQGRVLIPALLRDMFLKSTQSVRVSGAFDHVRIVSEEQARAEDEKFSSQTLDILELISQTQDDV